MTEGGKYFEEWKKTDDQFAQAIERASEHFGEPDTSNYISCIQASALEIISGELAHIADELHKLNESLERMSCK